MKGLFDNLLLYEIVLLFLGVFLFLLLSFALIYYIIKKEEIKKLLLFFALPIVMIAYPSIQQISISSDKFELSKYQEAYIENPNDSVAKQKLEDLSAKLEKRAETPEENIQISKTKLLLGNPNEAIIYANKAIVKQREDNASAPQKTASDTVINSSPIIYSQAMQLKELAQFQNNISTESNTMTLNANLKNIDVNKNLEGTKSIVRKNALEKMASQN